MPSYQGASNNNNKQNFLPNVTLPKDFTSQRQTVRQVDRAPTEEELNTYLRTYRPGMGSLRDDKPEQAAPKATPVFRTEAVYDGYDRDDYHDGMLGHYFGKKQSQPQQEDELTDPSLAFAKSGKVPAMNAGGYPEFPTGKLRVDTPLPSPRSTTPPPAPTKHIPADLAAANEKATRRKPVPMPDPKLGPAAPPHRRTISADELGFKVPTSHAKPATAGAKRYIGTTDEGKFDRGKIHPGMTARKETQMQMPQSNFGANQPSHSGRAAAMQMPKSTFDDEHDASERTVRPGIKRSDSSSSMHSISEGFKRLGSMVRRGSADFFENVSKAASLAAKHPSERKKYEEAKRSDKRDSARKLSAEREKACQQNPILRPAHEREALNRKNAEKFEQERRAGEHSPRTPNPYSMNSSRVVSHSELMAQAQERDALYRRTADPGLHIADQTQGDCAQPQGKLTAEMDFALSPTERQASRLSSGIPTRQESPPLDKWERAGKAVGKLADPCRRKRSSQSDFMGGECPEGAMDPCSRCGETPIAGALKRGLCGNCIEAMKYEKKQR